jgi:hypothetical protein
MSIDLKPQVKTRRSKMKLIITKSESPEVYEFLSLRDPATWHSYAEVAIAEKQRAAMPFYEDQLVITVAAPHQISTACRRAYALVALAESVSLNKTKNKDNVVPALDGQIQPAEHFPQLSTPKGKSTPSKRDNKVKNQLFPAFNNQMPKF